MAVNLARGRSYIDCGCAGPGRRQPLRPRLVARNLVLVGVALLAAGPVSSRAWVWMDAFTAGAGALVLLLLYAAVDGALAHAPGLAAERVRMRSGAWSTH